MIPELVQYELIGKEILQRVLVEDDPARIHTWLVDRLARIGGGDSIAVLTWPDSIQLVDRLLAEYEVMAATPPEERNQLTWPWESWRKLIDPLEEGMLGVVTAPDGQGKTMYAESLAEHWAKRRQRVVFVHYELNRRLMMLRRTARHTGLTVRELKSGMLRSDQKATVREARDYLSSWGGYITYLHTPGWTMERTVAELMRLHAEGECDVVVLDYLEKAAASERQGKIFGSNGYMREADNVEQLKNFAERSDIPVIMVAQMNKDAKGQAFKKVDRSGMRGAGEKSDKANLVVLLKRDRADDGYSNEVQVLVDKNTMGATGSFTQIMQPEYFRIADVFKQSKNGEVHDAELEYWQK